jgi:hypothetical protein
MLNSKPEPKTGWSSLLTRSSMAALLFLTVTGLAIAYAPFHAALEWGVLLHTGIGLLILVPLIAYLWLHWKDYQRYNLSDALLLGYVSTLAVLVCLVSGVVVTYQGLFALKMSPVWRNTHLYSTWAAVLTAVVHIVLVWVRTRDREPKPHATPVVWQSLVATVVGLALMFGLGNLYGGPEYVNEFPDDYSYLYGEDRPFAPSLANTTTGGAMDSESLGGSESCGSADCHTQILEEWKPSAHRYAAMDPLFQKVQSVMAEQNGPESTRYCGGCHDPISLFSGTKNIFAENLTSLIGYQEGISCLVCHGVRETDLQGNANYIMTQPTSYLWQWSENPTGKFVSDFLIRTYPDEHLKLSKRMFKAPEYCASCHKQFIDQEVNRVGWVQLQNQYDNWKASHWFVEGDPEKTVECRECHMPLIASTDPAAGDSTDYNRFNDDGMHRSHRFIAANSMVPALLELEGWERHVELTQEWLQGKTEIAEISDKWSDGPVIKMALETPETIEPGGTMPVRVIMTANKVGHDFPTGPLDIIQSWVELRVYDPAGEEIFATGRVDEKNFIEPGTFLFKAEPVDQYGNLIDRHNLWEMVGVRYRRALFPGYSDSVEYFIDCPTTVAPGEDNRMSSDGEEIQEFDVPLEASGEYRVVAKLMYRKVDQFLINYLLGEDSGLTAPVVEMSRVEATIQVDPQARQAGGIPTDETLPIEPSG